MRTFFVHWLLLAVSLGFTAWVLPGVSIDSLAALLASSLVLGFLNAVVKPVLVLLTLPVTVLSLGVFYFILNGILFGLAAWLVPGFHVRSLLWAVLGALLMGVLSWYIGAAFKDARGARAKVHAKY